MIIGLFFLFLFLCFASLILYTLRLGISPMPSSQKAMRAMVQLLPDKMDGGVIYELGSGWGGLALLVAKRHPETKVIAFELSFLPYLYSRMRKLLSRRANLLILRKDFYEQDLSDAKAILCYLFPGGMKKLSPKLKKELSANSAIISNTFSLSGWENGSVIFLDDWSATRIYRYSHGLRRSRL